MNTKATQPIRIFLADDDDDDREFFTNALEKVDPLAELVIAKDGAVLMKILDETVPPAPNIIFLDMNMPRKNGIECLKEIRENPKLKNIPVAIFSTTANENTIETTYSLGANCYLRKPNSNQLLKKAIETVLALNLWEQNQRLPKEKFVLAIA